MRPRPTVALCLAVALCHGGPRATLASDDDEIGRASRERERVEAALREYEARVQNEKWAVDRRRKIDDLRGLLPKADRVELFRLDPRRLATGGERANGSFHRYQILARADVGPAARRAEVVSGLADAFHWNPDRRGLCFDPGYGLRATTGDRAVDLVVCLDCWRVEVYEGEEMTNLVSLVPTGWAAAEKLLREAEKHGRPPIAP